MTLKIISAQEILYSGRVASATLPGSMGEFTVLRNHATLLATLVPGFIRYRTESGEELSCEVGGGIADIDNNVISVCVY
jgi:F-type H+-transporting ATPase subunit epsilon